MQVDRHVLGDAPRVEGVGAAISSMERSASSSCQWVLILSAIVVSGYNRIIRSDIAVEMGLKLDQVYFTGKTPSVVFPLVNSWG
jgi:hypothetical protein